MNVRYIFIPGETDRHEITLPYAPADCLKAVVSYSVNKKIVLEKTVEAFEAVDGAETQSCRITVGLSQRDTLMFENFKQVRWQVNLLLNNGTRHASSPETFVVGEQLHREVIQ